MTIVTFPLAFRGRVNSDLPTEMMLDSQFKKHKCSKLNAVTKPLKLKALFGYRLKFRHIDTDTFNFTVVWLIRSVAVIIGFTVASLRNFNTFFLILAQQVPQWARAPSFTRFLDQTQRRTTVGRTPLDERSARRRDLYLTIHNRQTSMFPV